MVPSLLQVHVSFNGAGRDINLRVNATTEQNTALFLPLYNAREVTEL